MVKFRFVSRLDICFLSHYSFLVVNRQTELFHLKKTTENQRMLSEKLPRVEKIRTQNCSVQISANIK